MHLTTSLMLQMEIPGEAHMKIWANYVTFIYKRYYLK